MGEEMDRQCGSQTCSRWFTATDERQLYCSKPCGLNEAQRRKKWRRSYGNNNHPFSEGPDTRKLRQR